MRPVVAICRLDSPQLQVFHVFQRSRPRCQRIRRDSYPVGSAWVEYLVPGLRLHLPNFTGMCRRPLDVRPVAQPGLRLPRAARRNHAPGRRLQHPRLRPHARHRCRFLPSWPRSVLLAQSPALLPMAACWGAAVDMALRPRRREPQHRPRLVGSTSIINRKPFSAGPTPCLNALYLVRGSRRPLAQAEVLKAMLAYILLRSALLSPWKPLKPATPSIFSVFFRARWISRISSLLSRITRSELPLDRDRQPRILAALLHKMCLFVCLQRKGIAGKLNICFYSE